MNGALVAGGVGIAPAVGAPSGKRGKKERTAANAAAKAGLVGTGHSMTPADRRRPLAEVQNKTRSVVMGSDSGVRGGSVPPRCEQQLGSGLYGFAQCCV